MNIFMIWVVAAAILFATASVWALMTPVYKIMVNTLNTTAYNMGLAGSDLNAIDRVYGTLNLGFLIIPATVILAVLIWAYMSSQRRDYETDIYTR